jgi:hypothetical protein
MCLYAHAHAHAHAQDISGPSSKAPSSFAGAGAATHHTLHKPHIPAGVRNGSSLNFDKAPARVPLGCDERAGGQGSLCVTERDGLTAVAHVCSRWVHVITCQQTLCVRVNADVCLAWLCTHHGFSSSAARCLYSNHVRRRDCKRVSDFGRLHATFIWLQIG